MIWLSRMKRMESALLNGIVSIVDMLQEISFGCEFWGVIRAVLKKIAQSIYMIYIVVWIFYCWVLSAECWVLRCCKEYRFWCEFWAAIRAVLKKIAQSCAATLLCQEVVLVIISYCAVTNLYHIAQLLLYHIWRPSPSHFIFISTPACRFWLVLECGFFRFSHVALKKPPCKTRTVRQNRCREGPKLMFIYHLF